MSDRESAAIALIKEQGVGDRFVLKDIQPQETDPHGRGEQKATVKYFEKFQPQNLVFVGIIAQYFREDGPLLMPGGNLLGTREGASVTAQDNSIELENLGPIALTVPPNVLLYYKDGATRILSMTETLDEILPAASGSVHRYIGECNNPSMAEMKFRGVRFNGTSEDDPLTFAVLKDIGYVYLHGKGTVTLQDGTKAELGLPRTR